MSRPSLNVLLVGYGKMGSALLQRWSDRALFSRCVVVDPSSSPPRSTGAIRVSTFRDIPKDFFPNVIVFAIKPQQMDDSVRFYARHKDALFVSIAAGKPISYFEQALGKDARIVRAMPNTPAAIGKGVTVACANRNVSLIEKDWAHSLLVAVGDVVWISQEDLLNPVTALSGSGPAYVFLLIETLAHAGEKAGLPAPLAAQLARQTVVGSAILAESHITTSPADLRAEVTSPGGTTEAALKVLMNNDILQDLFDRALSAATRRAEELSE